MGRPHGFDVKTKTIHIRDLLNNSRMYQDVTKGMKNMLAYTNTSDRHNAIFGKDDLNRDMMTSALKDSFVGGCANAKKYMHRNIPSDRWYASAIRGIDQDKIRNAFQAQIARQFAILKRLGKILKDGLVVVIYMHIISSYDRVPWE